MLRVAPREAEVWWAQMSSTGLEGMGRAEMVQQRACPKYIGGLIPATRNSVRSKTAPLLFLFSGHHIKHAEKLATLPESHHISRQQCDGHRQDAIKPPSGSIMLENRSNRNTSQSKKRRNFASKVNRAKKR